LADALKEFVEENMIPELVNGFAADLINAAMSDIDWFEIAENLREE
jgi:hypothetical protein